MATATQASKYAIIQRNIANKALQQLTDAFPDLASDPVRAKAQLIELVKLLQNTYGPVSAEAAAQYYGILRDQAGSLAQFQIRTIPGLVPGEVDGSARWATQPLFDENRDEALKRSQGTLERLTKEWGRRTFMWNIRNDPSQPGYARVPTGRDTCAFCRMLAGRGAVYFRDTVTSTADMEWYHDHCDCQMVAVWKPSDLPFDPGVFEAEYYAATKDAGSTNLSEVLSAMRKAGNGH